MPISNELPSWSFTRFTTEHKIGETSPRQADFCEKVANVFLGLWRLGDRTIKVTDETFTLSPKQSVGKKVARIALLILFFPIVLPGFVFLGLSSTHSATYSAVQAEAYRKEGNFKKARTCMIRALKRNHKQHWMTLWVERLAWDKAFGSIAPLPSKEKILSHFNDAKALMKFVTYTKYRDHLPKTPDSKSISQTCEFVFSARLTEAKRKRNATEAFKKVVKELEGLNIRNLKLDNLNLEEADFLIHRIPTLQSIDWNIPHSDQEDLEAAKKHLKFAHLYNSDTNHASMQNLMNQKIVGAINNGMDSFKEIMVKLQDSMIKELNLSNLSLTEEHLDHITKLPHLTTLNLKNCPDLEPDNLKKLKSLANLKNIQISMTISSEEKEELQQLLACDISGA